MQNRSGFRPPTVSGRWPDVPPRVTNRNRAKEIGGRNRYHGGRGMAVIPANNLTVRFRGPSKEPRDSLLIGIIIFLPCAQNSIGDTVQFGGGRWPMSTYFVEAI